MFIDVRDILKTSGLSKTVELEASAPDMGLSDNEGGCEFDEPLRITAELANIRGIVRVKGAIKTAYKSYCARCLKPVRVIVDKRFDDEYVRFGSMGEITAEEAEVFEYSDKEIDISLAVREAVLLEIPIRHLCGEDCRSLCPYCGRDLNEGICGCEKPVGDIRFAALEKLKEKFDAGDWAGE